MNIVLKNGDALALQENATCLQAAQAISEGLARNAVCAKVNGALVDLSHTLKDGDALELIFKTDREYCTYVRKFAEDHIADVIAIGYKYEYFKQRLPLPLLRGRAFSRISSISATLCLFFSAYSSVARISSSLMNSSAFRDLGS